MTGAGVNAAPETDGHHPHQEGEQRQRKPPSSQGSGGAVYGLGLIGALVWYWRHADSASGRVLGVLKAFVWPAFLVYGALDALRRATASP
jgi:hypothetical protein